MTILFWESECLMLGLELGTTCGVMIRTPRIPSGVWSVAILAAGQPRPELGQDK
jgi:hypothetical protein